MRIATWNVNSLKARLERVEEWLALKSPDVLLMQETKLADEAAPAMPFRMAGYDLLHHGEGRWNGVAIASRVGIADAVTNFGDGPVRQSPGTDGIAEALEPEASDAPADEARMVSAVCGGVRVVSIYAPNGRALDTPFYRAKLAWFDRLARWLRETCDPSRELVIGGDFNVAPEDADVYDMAAYVGATHVSAPERAAMAALRDWGLVDAYRLHHPEPGKFSWWDYRAGNFHKGLGMRIDHLYVTQLVADRCIGAEIDRDARKGKLPSDHAPVYIDLAD
ncbi:MAG: exodeoxyribonuclease III [Candidatus Limnocylindrales bacterium]|jgi:exodeoxyribonuclease-3